MNEEDGVCFESISQMSGRCAPGKASSAIPGMASLNSKPVLGTTHPCPHPAPQTCMLKPSPALQQHWETEPLGGNRVEFGHEDGALPLEFMALKEEDAQELGKGHGGTATSQPFTRKEVGYCLQLNGLLP